jgi:hypothetical protein
MCLAEKMCLGGGLMRWGWIFVIFVVEILDVGKI